jgi:hypothetical protein
MMATAGATFRNRDELMRGLRDAVELEMNLMIQYLYAAYSVPSYATGLKYVEEGLWTQDVLRLMCGEEAQRLERGLRGRLLRTANEEMIHFLMVNNLLMSVGGSFYVSSPDFSLARKRYGLSAEMALEPLTTSSIDRFIAFETPAEHQADEGPPQSGRPNTYTSVSGLYRMIRNTFAAHPEYIMVRPGETGGEHHLFMLATTNKYHPDFQCQVDDVQSALFTIDTITEQGEGGEPGGESFEDSHWRRFQRMREELERIERAHGPVALYPCVSNASQFDRAGTNKITNEQTLEVLEVFNASFAISMQMMVQHFCLGPRRTLRRSRLMNASIDVMGCMMAPLAVVLMCSESGIAGKTAGPSFELPYPIQFIPDQEVTQRLWSRQFDELAAVAASNRLVPDDITLLLREYSDYAKKLST